MLICHPYNFFGKSSVYILVHSKYWVACFLMVNFKTLFGNNYRFKGSCKEMYSLQSLSPSVNILPNYGTILISENWHWYNPQRLFRFYQLYIYLCVCVFLCSFITCMVLCRFHNNQRTELCHHHNVPLILPLHSLTHFLLYILYPCQPLFGLPSV